MVKPDVSPIGPSLGSEIPRFGTDGIRGLAGMVLSPAFCLQVGFWVGRVLEKEGPVLIGMDSRSSGSMVVSALTAGLTAAGREVWGLGLCPTPMVSRLISRFRVAGGLMVSASHNPPADNGIKVFGSDGAKVSSGLQARIEEGLRGDLDHQGIKSYGAFRMRSDLLNIYKLDLLKSVGEFRLDGVQIVLDLCWGSATACSAEVFRSLGADVIVLHGEPQGNLINVACGSTQLNPLRKVVIESGATMGFAFDGDADRMLAVDGYGRVVNGDHVLFLWGSVLKDQQALPDKLLVATVMSNLGFERAWKKIGGLLKRTQVGDQHVYETMVSTGAALGGEQSGHILSSSHGFCGDGILTALQIATLCHSKKLNLSEWLDLSFKAFPQKLVNINVLDETKLISWKNSEVILEAISLAEESMGNDGRVLVRASGTEAVLRLMVEASDQKIVDYWTNYLSLIIDKHLNLI